MINFRTSYVASCKAKAKAAAEQRCQWRVARQQKNGKLSAPNFRFDLFAAEADALRMAEQRMQWNPGSVYVVVAA